jgi:ABC-type glycerol-3-phosphate transport system substrate-binding protein
MYINPKKKKYLTGGIVTAVVALLVVFAVTRGGAQSFRHRWEGTDLTPPLTSRGNTYTRFIEEHRQAGTPTPGTGVNIDIVSFNAETSADVEIKHGFEGAETVIKISDTGFVEYTVNVPEAGLYNLRMTYFPIESRGVDIERALYINGEIPFLGADLITFNRVWGDHSDGHRFDNQGPNGGPGNQIRATQIEIPRWETMFFMDSQGYVTEPLMFYFERGENTIALQSINEPIVIKVLEIVPVREIPYYRDYIAGYNLADFPGRINTPIKIQGEDSSFRSSPSLYPFFDTSSATTEPYSVRFITLNAIGGERWRVPGQWIEWEFEAPEDAMYAFSFKARQNYNRGMVSNRMLMINGVVPCREVMAIPFKYSNAWELVTPTCDDGNVIYFPLKAGVHTIRLQVTLGDLSQTLAELEDSIFRINEIYRDILVLTGTEPDPHRDYRINEHYPDMLDRMDFEARYLYMLMDNIIEYSGQMGPEVATLQTIARLFDNFIRKPQDIPRGVEVFKLNISALGTTLITLNSSPLDIDWLMFSTDNNTLPRVSENFFQSATHEIRSFLASFFVDYNAIGDIHVGENITEVWIFSGRDQSTVLKSMIDDTYTPNTGKPVNLKLVDMLALMPAVVADTGPDVAVSVNNPDPINYALRRAALDLTLFSDFPATRTEFHESAFVPYTFRDPDTGREQIFGMPETQIFGVMFYRTDIFEQLGLVPPQTWDELIAIIPVLYQNNMEVGIPSVERQIGGMRIPDLSNLFAQLLQRGGSLYTEDGARSRFDSEESVAAFEAYIRFFTHYKTPLHYDFVNRFRSGEMPIGFADYNNFNTLTVFAPEIRGLWAFDLLPGTMREDGTIDRSTASWGQATMILFNTRDRYNSWDFVRWWVSSDTQVRFGRELEAVMGAAARHPTANREAFNRLGWNSRDNAIINAQWDYVIGIPEVPGGYYAGRHMVNAVRRVINDDEDVRETLLDYTRAINNELIKKRQEFGLE